MSKGPSRGAGFTVRAGGSPRGTHVPRDRPVQRTHGSSGRARQGAVVVRGLAAVTLLLVSAACTSLPAPIFPIRDDAGLLGPSELGQVRELCAHLERETGAEIGVLILESSDGANHHAHALRIYNHWGIGKAGRDNGVLIYFAIADRRVEIVPGDGFRELFAEDTARALLERVVVPRMRRKEPKRAVLAIVAEVAAMIREHEAAHGQVVEAMPASDAAVVPAFGNGATTGQGTSASGQGVGRGAIGSIAPWLTEVSTVVLATVLTLFWYLGLVALVVFIFRSGRMIMPKWSVVVAAFVPVAAWGVALAVELATAEGDLTVLLVAGGGSATVATVLAACARHFCPRCNKWMRVATRTIDVPTHFSDGSAERTRYCPHCEWYETSTVTLGRTAGPSSRSSGSSGGSSSGSSGSFGGGTSSGGGGGASW